MFFNRTTTKLYVTLIVLILMAVSSVMFLPSYLSMNRKVDAGILVVEGWLPYTGLEKAFHEFQNGQYDTILLTGNLLKDHVTLSTNSFLVIYPEDGIRNDTLIEDHKFYLDIKSSQGESDSAHFVFFVNNHAIADFFTPQNGGIFELEWKGRSVAIDSVMIQFDNDWIGNGEDRNLLIKSVLFNGEELLVNHIPRFVDRGRPFGKYRWNVQADSYAEMAANYFTDRGLSPNIIIPVPNLNQHIRRTYGNALALKEWFETNSVKVSSMNIVSLDYHSRRTWLIYNRLLGDNREVGIISAKNIQKESNPKAKTIYIIRESLALLYYHIFILPWVG
jgi:hypothetical protein